MDNLLACARVALGAIFAVAAFGKLADQDGSREAVQKFGVPSSAARAVAIGLPALELSVSVGLLVGNTARVAALAGFLLLCAFELGIAWNLLRGRTPDCHCFGQLHSKPLSWTLFVRNLGLMSLAALVLFKGPGSTPMVDAMEGLFLVLNASLVGLLLSAGRQLRQVRTEQTAILESLQRLTKKLEEGSMELPTATHPKAQPPQEGLPVGAKAPPFRLATVAGDSLSLQDLLNEGRWLLLVFVSPNCATCRPLLPQISQWQQDHAQHLRFVVISRGTVLANKKKLAEYSGDILLIPEESALAGEYEARWTPAAVLVNPAGRIASPVRAGPDHIHDLVADAASVFSSQPKAGIIPGISLGNSSLEVGQPAPRFSLPRPTGEEFSLTEQLGRPQLLVFWNPGCPFCRELAEHFTAWDPISTLPELVVVAAGQPDAAQEILGQRRCVTLADQKSSVATLYGVTGVPSAVLLDFEGHIASSLAVGSKHILALAGLNAR